MLHFLKQLDKIEHVRVRIPYRPKFPEEIQTFVCVGTDSPPGITVSTEDSAKRFKNLFVFQITILRRFSSDRRLVRHFPFLGKQWSKQWMFPLTRHYPFLGWRYQSVASENTEPTPGALLTSCCNQMFASVRGSGDAKTSSSHFFTPTRAPRVRSPRSHLV